MAGKKKNQKRNPSKLRLLKKILYFFLVLLIGFGAFLGFYMLQGRYGDFPDKQTLKEIEQAQAT